MTTSKDPIEREFQQYLSDRLEDMRFEALEEFVYEVCDDLRDSSMETKAAVYRRLRDNL